MTLSLIRGLSRPCLIQLQQIEHPGFLLISSNFIGRSHKFCSQSKSGEPPPPPTSPSKTTSSDKNEKQKPAAKYSREAVRQNVKGYVFTRYIDYVKNYDKILEKKFPQAMHVYRLFFDGVKDFLQDMKRYLKIARIANGSSNGLRALTRKELELYLQMPRDMVKIAPALLFTALPFVGNFIFPIAYSKPRTFLTSHFWTLQQKTEFQKQYLKERFSYNKNVFRYLQAKLKSSKKDPLYMQWRSTLGLIGSGQHPTPDELLAIKDVFSIPPYQYNYLTSSHVKNLCQVHGLPWGPFKRTRLLEHAYLIHHMDLAIMREGDVHNMTPESLRFACYLRGLNPSNMSNEQLIDWLRQWVKVSLAIEEEHISLFLHLPILLAYNHPNNWKIIH